MAAVRNLVNISGVSKDYAARTILSDVTLGIADGERIGIVGQNGQGKSTLLTLIAGLEQPDGGQVVQTSGLSIGWLAQGDELDGEISVEQALAGDRPEHEWTADRDFRDVLTGLLGGTALSRFPGGRATPVHSLSGGERRRIALANLLLTKPELLLLDEPTNHLDVEAISWLAGHLRRRSGAMAIITHDRWFLDEVTTTTWEVADQTVHQYEGGYAAYVLARAERARQAAAVDAKRRQLISKELAWLRRGPPARTSKPKFRIEAANALIADEPPLRNTTELLGFARSRIGNTVLEAEAISFAYEGREPIIRDLTWRIGPGDRSALVGVNGSGKSTLLALLAGELAPAAGQLVRGQTVKLGLLSQHAAELPANRNVLEALAEVRQVATLADGSQISAGRLAERFGFRGERLRTLVRDLSGGERRRLALMRLLMGEPNVLLLDEPTNDLDIDTLNALEDLLDGWGGTIVVVSHDRYFIERVTDNVYALTGVGAGGHSIRHVPGGVEQYLAELGAAGSDGVGQAAPSAGPSRVAGPAATAPAKRAPGAGGEAREARKELARLEREIERATAREAALQAEMAAASSDHVRLGELTATLNETAAAREALEERWLVASEALEG